jgi:hypothetical protein
MIETELSECSNMSSARSSSLFDGVTPQMFIYREEIFGPVLSCVRVPDLAEGIALINSHDYGNGVSIFTRDGHAAREFGRAVEVGMVGINVPIPGSHGLAWIWRLEEKFLWRHARVRRRRRAILHQPKVDHAALA